MVEHDYSQKVDIIITMAETSRDFLEGLIGYLNPIPRR